MKMTTLLLFPITLTLLCMGLLTEAQAVSPPPDGGYPGGNTAEGQNALLNLITGIYNTAVGLFSLTSNIEGKFNTATGAGTLLVNTADENTATGAGALLSNTTAGSNTANGAFALFSTTTGGGNTAIGDSALFSNTEGNLNTAVGLNALLSNTTGTFNTGVGRGALDNNATGGANIALGAFAGNAVSTADNVIAIGTGGENVSDSCYIGNIWNQSGGSQAVYVNSDGKLGAQVSSRRYKDEIRPIEQASKVIYGLKPVSFRYKPEIEPTRPLGFGLIAEEVEKISPELVTRGRDGQINTVRYDAVNAMLLNEFLKAHRKIEEQEAAITQLKKGMETVVARLKEHDSKFEK